jgi:hypothetical protein
MKVLFDSDVAHYPLDLDAARLEGSVARGAARAGGTSAGAAVAD